MLHVHVAPFLVHPRHLFIIPFSSHRPLFPPRLSPELRSHIRPPPWAFSKVFRYVVFVIHHSPPQSIYTRTSVCPRIVFSSSQQRSPPCLLVRTWTRVFQMTRAETPSSREARPNRHTARDVTGSAKSIPGVRTKFPKLINDLLHEVLSFQRD